MKRLRIMMVACVASCGAVPTALAAPARFWFSYSNIDPDGIEAPQIDVVENVARYLYIWGQPETQNAGDYNVTTNRFKSIQNLSLDLVTDVAADNSDAILDFLDGTFTLYNPVLDGKRRFLFAYDSHFASNPPVPDEELRSTGETLDAVKGLLGLSIFPATVNGIGHSTNPAHAALGCHPNDPYCAPTDDAQQSPAWLVASVAVKTTATTGNSYLHLQIGENGMAYKNETTQASAIVFGLNSPAPGPTYDANVTVTPLFNERQTTKTGDNFDAKITAFDPLQVQLSTWNGTTGSWTENSWTGGVPQSFSRDAKLPASLASSSVVTVTGKQLANETTVDGGRLHLAGGASLASQVTVGSGGAISGQGWVGSDLTLQSGATLLVDSLQPLLVVGSANVAGAALRLGSNFTGSGSTPIEILRTQSGIQGAFAPAVGQNLGGGLFVGAISQVGNSIFLQLSGVAGDYNGNNVVDAADYVMWRDRQGCNTVACISADGDHNGMIDQADYAVWRAHFGQTPAGSSATNELVVPEPASLVLLILAVAGVSTRRRTSA